MKLLFENWRNHLNEGLEERYEKSGLEERYEKFFNPKGWYFESEILLGEGGYGKVWRATNKKTGQRAAIKILPVGMDLGYPELKIELENYEYLKNNRNSMPKEVEDKVGAIETITSVKVHIVFDPPWDKEMMSEEAKLDLGMI